MGEIVVDTRRNVGTAILRREDSPAMQGTFDDYSCLFYENNLKNVKMRTPPKMLPTGVWLWGPLFGLFVGFLIIGQK